MTPSSRHHHGRSGRRRPRDHRQGLRPAAGHGWRPGELRLLVIGSRAALEAARTALGSTLAIPEVQEGDADWPALACLQAGPEGEPIRPGVLSADGGRFAYLAVERACGWPRPGAIAGPSSPRR